MKNNFKSLTAFIILSVGISYGQIGIGNTSPQSTLDVTGQESTTTVADGIIAPRLTGDQLAAKDAVYLAAQTGAQVYVTAPATTPAGKTINITSAGYYFFDGSVWQKVTSGAEASKWKTETYLDKFGVSQTATFFKPALINTDTISYNHVDKVFRFKNNGGTRQLEIPLDKTSSGILTCAAENNTAAGGTFVGSLFSTFGTNPVAGQTSSAFFSSDYTKNISSNVTINVLRLRPTLKFATGLVDTSISNFGINNAGFLRGGGTFNRYTSYHANNQISEGTTIVDYRNYNSEATTATAAGLSSTITNLYHYYANNVFKCGTCTISNQYGLYVANMNGATNNFAIYTNTGKVSFGGDLELRSITTGTAVNGLGVDATGKVIRTLAPVAQKFVDGTITTDAVYTAGNVGIGTATPDASSVLDINSTTKGLLIPRMTSLERAAITSPAAGLQVYDITTNSNWFFNGTSWVDSSSSQSASKFTNNATLGVVALTNLSDGVTARPANKELLISDEGQLAIGKMQPTNKEKLYIYDNLINDTRSRGIRADIIVDNTPTTATLTGSSFGINSESTNSANHVRMMGLDGGANHSGTGNVTELRGGSFGATSHSVGNIQTSMGIFAQSGTSALSSGAITSVSGVTALATSRGTGTITNANTFFATVQRVTGSITNGSAYRVGGVDADNANGVFIANVNGTTNGAGIRIGSVSGLTRHAILTTDSTLPSSFAGSVGIGTTTPSAVLDVSGINNKYGLLVRPDNIGAHDLTPFIGTNKLLTGWNRTSAGRDIALINTTAFAGGLDQGFTFWNLEDTGATTLLMRLDNSTTGPLMKVNQISVGAIANPVAKLTVDGYIKLGTADAAADAAPTPGMMRYNATTNKFQGYVGGATPGWVDLN